ncbi:hypothetical protein NM688_g6572 [Phlebia brevispora]|uniref:Uncharacterized protein n=1 Tax=Phlebia brevispora TaxID=194682 RepID=A0ACC1SEK7_9APHY|nr:hypothetical protein NM688_g6572 [Phlebia brevispora]
MASADVWADFETYRHNVKINTVDKLKHILSMFNDQCGTNLTKGGKKQELIERITRELDLWKRTGNTEKWAKAKVVLNQVRAVAVPSYTSYRAAADNSYTSSSHSVYSTGASSSSVYRPPTSSIPRYDPYAPPRRPAPPTAGTSSGSAHSNIQFKYSPFFKVEKLVSTVIECPESTSQMDRKQQLLTFTITNDISAKLASTNPKYQLRLYCTSSTYYSTGFRQTNAPCPIEFPPTCEVRVNGQQLNANLKGMKKKPGTAPPPDLGKHLRLTVGISNRVEMVYVNSQQPIAGKKYYLVVMLVEVTSVDQLVERLRKGKYKSSSEIVAKMIQTASEDDDIIAGSQKLSLKCPLSYMRIATPCRSSTCVHAQCFDAYSWYSVMEQTTTWLCPVCEKVLNTEELIVDGYFDDILKGTDEDVEDVMVEADGQWHTSDNKYGSAAWKEKHPPLKEEALSVSPSSVKPRSPSPAKPIANGNGTHAKTGTGNPEIVVLDSDDEEEGQVKRELSPTAYRSANASLASIASNPPRSQTAESDVIDLTLDSDDDEPLSLSQSRSQSQSQGLKRKSDDREATSPTEVVWSKKSRTETPSALSSPGAGPSYVNGGSYSSPRDLTRTLPPPSPSRFATTYPRPPPAYNGSYIPPGSAPIPTRMPPAPTLSPTYTAPFVTRPNGASTPSTQTWRA